MLDKAGQSDRMRTQDNRLREFERKNLRLEQERNDLTPFFIGRIHICTTNLGIW